MNKNILNNIIIEWNNSDFNDSGLLKSSDIKKKMRNSQLVYTLRDKHASKIQIFKGNSIIGYKFKDKVYINGEHVELDERGVTIYKYEPGKYHVYIDGFDELNEIDKFAFQYCHSLTSLTIPDSVTKIRSNAFYNCYNLTSVIIPDSVKEIDGWAFEFCESLTSVTIPNSVTMISKGLFAYCEGLASITIPNSVTSIDDSAFAYCTGLTSVIIPNSVTSIGHYAFEKSRNLKKVYVENIDKFNQIKFGNEYSNPTCYGAKLIEIK